MPRLEIPGAKVTPLGVSVDRGMSITINGRRMDDRPPRWIFRWMVEVPKAGKVRVGPVTAIQGSRRAVAAAGDIPVQDVDTAPDIKF